MSQRLAGYRLLVVGASSGIGASLVQRAAGSGARVVAAARRPDALAEVVAGASDASALALDVRDGAAVRGAVDAAAGRLGGLDAVVYAAGVSPLLSVAEAGPDDWADVLATNVVGCALVAAAAARHLLATDGRFVALSSKAVRQPFADLGLYATSKAALDGLLRCLPLDLPGLRVTRVVVGNTHGTEFASAWDPDRLAEALDRWARHGALGSTATMAPDDVADAVLDVLVSRVHIDDIALLEDPPGAGG